MSAKYVFPEEPAPSLTPLSDRIKDKIAQVGHDLEALRKLQALIENDPDAVEAVLAGLQALGER